MPPSESQPWFVGNENRDGGRNSPKTVGVCGENGLLSTVSVGAG